MSKSLFEQIIDRSATYFTSEDLKGITKIGIYSFSSLANLTSINIPTTVNLIEEYAFSACSSLESIIIPDNVSEIKSSAFQFCSKLSSITLPNNINKISNYLFRSCTSLENISIPNSVNVLGMGSFYGCSKLSSITIPNSVTDIDKVENSITDYGTFESCTGLKTINFSSNMKYIQGYMFEGCTGLDNISIPNHIEEIRISAFAGCTNVVTITIPSSVTLIESGAFKGGSNLSSGSHNKLTTITFNHPSNSTITMGSGIFDVKNARSVNVYTDNETIKNYDWAGDNITATFYHLDGTAWA